MTIRTAFPVRAAVVALGLFAVSASASAQQGDDIDQRLDRLENSLRQLTGTIEQLQYRNQQIEQRLNSMGGAPAVQSVPAAGGPAPIVAAPPAAAPVAKTLAPNGRRSDAFDPNANPDAPGVPRVLGGTAALPSDGAVGAPGGREAGAPLDLGTGNPPGALPAPPQRNASASAGNTMTLPPSATPRAEFDMGIGFMQRKEYDDAEQTLRNYLKKYPTDSMAGEAQFWVGESLYQRQRYQDAAEAFLLVRNNYGSSPKTPDALLRLGQSLAAINAKEAACAALGEVTRKYPKAAAGVKKGVETEQKKNSC